MQARSRPAVKVASKAESNSDGQAMSAYLDGKPYHVAYVVPDLDAAVDRLLVSGFGPAHFIRGTDMAALYRGEKINIRVSAAFVVIAGLLTELVMQEDDSRSSFTDFIARHPSGALHHVAYLSEDFAATLKDVQARGLSLVPHMEYLDPNGNKFESYFEAQGHPDAVLLQLALPSPLDPVYAKIVEIAENWDGRDPKRDFWALAPPGLLG